MRTARLKLRRGNLGAKFQSSLRRRCKREAPLTSGSPTLSSSPVMFPSIRQSLPLPLSLSPPGSLLDRTHKNACASETAVIHFARWMNRGSLQILAHRYVTHGPSGNVRPKLLANDKFKNAEADPPKVKYRRQPHEHLPFWIRPRAPSKVVSH